MYKIDYEGITNMIKEFRPFDSDFSFNEETMKIFFCEEVKTTKAYLMPIKLLIISMEHWLDLNRDILIATFKGKENMSQYTYLKCSLEIFKNNCDSIKQIDITRFEPIKIGMYIPNIKNGISLRSELILTYSKLLNLKKQEKVLELYLEKVLSISNFFGYLINEDSLEESSNKNGYSYKR